MLEALGLSQHTESVYLALLSSPETRAGDLGSRLNMDERQVLRAMEDLAGMSLLQASLTDPKALRPVNPVAALPALVARRQAEFARLQQELEEGKAAVTAMLAEHAELHPPMPAPDVEYVDGADAIDARLRELINASRWEVCSLVPAESQLPLTDGADHALQAEAIERGVRYRALLPDCIRNNQSTLEHAQSLIALGSEVRTAPLLPLPLFIIDRVRALVPVDPGRGSDLAAMVSSAGMVTALLALFHSTWKAAAPLGAPRRRDENGLCAQRKQVLRLLAVGSTDDAIARRLGVSVRTARRVASELLSRLDARSRFQAGARAVACGWLDVDDLDVP